jgi:hypothetical protein
VSEHNPELNPVLDEIEGLAAVAASFWLNEADSAADENIADQKRAPAAVAGFQIAAAIQYQAERQVDAAYTIAEGLRAVASAIRETRHATEGGAP